MLRVVDVSCSAAETSSTSWSSPLSGSDEGLLTEGDELRAALESSNEGIGLYDDDNRLVVFNARFAALHAALGRATASDEQRSDQILNLPLGTRPNTITWQEVDGVFRGNSCNNHHVVRLLPDGRSYQIAETTMPNQWRAVIWTDVTDHLRVEEQLERVLSTSHAPKGSPASRAALRIQPTRSNATVTGTSDERHLASVVESGEPLESAAATAKTSLAVDHRTSGIVHDFNNMLTAVIGSLELLQSGLEQQPNLQQAARSAWLAARRAATLANELLAASSGRRADPTPVNVNDIIVGMGDLLRRSAGGSVHTDYHLADDLWPAFVDAHQLESALLNLVINARHAMQGEGRLTITTSNATLDESIAATLPGCEPGPYVAVTVSDTGCGMTADIKARIFEPFFTTKARGEGSGLGLSMVHDSVTQWAGAIAVESEPGHGTTFRLYIPRQETRPDDQDTCDYARPVPTTPGRRSETILVVEDEPDLRDLAANLLEDVGYEVLKAANADEALATLSKHDDVSLVFSDVMMPGGMTGIHLARILRKRWPHIAVLLTSGYSHDFAGAGMPASACKIQKPYGSSALITSIRRLLDRAPSRTQPIAGSAEQPVA